MDITGYSTTSEENIIRQRKYYKEKFEKIKNIKGITIDFLHKYSRTRFKGVLSTPEAKELTELELAIFADNGCLPFGGYCNKSGNTFAGAFFTD